MKPNTNQAVSTTFRCLYRSPSGRQCRVLASDVRSGLCARHRAEMELDQSADVYDSLSRDCQRFYTAQGINNSLHNLYGLLARNEISPRRAAVLAYINSLLLRTLPAIDYDQEKGIINPDAPPAPELAGPEVATADVTETAPQNKTGSTTSVGSGNSTDSWDPRLPQPDPTKKPS